MKILNFSINLRDFCRHTKFTAVASLCELESNFFLSSLLSQSRRSVCRQQQMLSGSLCTNRVDVFLRARWKS